MTRIEITRGRYQARDGAMYRPGDIADLPEDEAVSVVQANVGEFIQGDGPKPIPAKQPEIEETEPKRGGFLASEPKRGRIGKKPRGPVVIE